MALCESQLESGLRPLREGGEELPPPNGAYPLEQVGGALPLAVDYRSPVSHFVPPQIELFAARKSEPINNTPESSASAAPTPMKRKRGRPRVDKSSPEYLANLAARKQAREMAAMMNRSNADTPPGEKRKRGRPRIDKTSPEYLARKRARELEALERKAKREYRRRTTGDSAASSSGEGTPRVKRKYTKRAPSAKTDSTGAEKVKGKRGRPRKMDQLAKQMQQPKIRVRSNLMPTNNETITLDSDDEPDLGSPSQASDSLSLDENLRALRHIHEKYANIDKDDLYEAHLLAANFKKPPQDQRRDDDEVLSIRSSEGNASVKESEPRVEKLEDSSNSDSDSSSSGSGSGSSSSSSSSSSGSSSSSSDSSDSDSDDEKPNATLNDNPNPNPNPPQLNNDRSFGSWSYNSTENDHSNSDSDSDPERGPTEVPAAGSHDEISESENESADKSFQCHICRKWYSTRVTLKIHRRSHLNRGGGGGRSRARSSDRYECDCCNETFTRREKLWEHKASAHRGAMTVRCEVCRKCFEDDSELSVHNAMHTADERAGRCTDCGASFQRYDQLRRHRAVAHAAACGSKLPHACAQCGKRFGHAHSLTRHMQNHAKQLYRCVVCKASFARADQLAQHLNSHLANYKRLKP